MRPPPHPPTPPPRRYFTPRLETAKLAVVEELKQDVSVPGHILEARVQTTKASEMEERRRSTKNGTRDAPTPHTTSFPVATDVDAV